MSYGIYARINGPEKELLFLVARTSRYDPRDLAALYIRQGLELAAAIAQDQAQDQPQPFDPDYTIRDGLKHYGLLAQPQADPELAE